MAQKKLLLFPGQGTQKPGMGKTWFDNFSTSKHAYEEASDFTGIDLAKICFGDDSETLKKSEITQPAILTTSVAIFRAIETEKNLGENNIFAGHSLGEFSALVAAKSFALGETAKLVQTRGKLMEQAVPAGTGSMVAVIPLPNEDFNNFLPELISNCNKNFNNKFIYPGNINSKNQIVLSGHTECVKWIVENYKDYPIKRAIQLAVSGPFHSPLMKPAAENFLEHLNMTAFTNNDSTYIANVSGDLQDLKEQQTIVNNFYQQITKPVLWLNSMNTAINNEINCVVEFGPGNILTNLFKKCLPNNKNSEDFSFNNFIKTQDLQEHTNF